MLQCLTMETSVEHDDADPVAAPAEKQIHPMWCPVTWPNAMYGTHKTVQL